MGHTAQDMVHDAVDAFLNRNGRLAREILDRSLDMNRHRRVVFEELTSEVTDNPELMQHAVDLMLVTRDLERIADHAMSIAERVVSVATVSAAGE